MAVESTLTKRIYQANGDTREWPVPFAYSRADDLRLILTDADGKETLITSNYRVNVNESGDTSVTFPLEGQPLPAGRTLAICRDTPRTQIVDLINAGAFHPDVLEHDGLDRLEMQIQEIQDGLDRSVKVSISGEQTPEELLSDLFGARKDAEQSAGAARSAQEGAENARDGAREALSAASVCRDAACDCAALAGTARDEAESARESAETAQNAAETARAGAESARDQTPALAAEAAQEAALAAAAAVFATKADKHFIPDPDNPDNEITVDPKYNYEKHEADLLETNDRLASLIGAVAYVPAHDFGDPAGYPDEGEFQDALTAEAVAYFPAWEQAGLPNALAVKNLWNGHEWVYSADLTYWTDNGPGGTAAFTQQLAGVIRGRDAFGYVKAEIDSADNSTVGRVAGLESAGEGWRLLGDDGSYHGPDDYTYHTRQTITTSGTFTAQKTGWHRVACIGGGGAGGKGGGDISGVKQYGYGGRQGGTTSFGTYLSAIGGSGGAGGGSACGGGGGQAGIVQVAYVYLTAGQVINCAIGAGAAATTGYATSYLANIDSSLISGKGPAAGIFTGAGNDAINSSAGQGAAGAGNGNSRSGRTYDWPGAGGAGGLNGTGYGGGGGGGASKDYASRENGGAASDGGSYGGRGGAVTTGVNIDSGNGGAGGKGAIIIEY